MGTRKGYVITKSVLEKPLLSQVVRVEKDLSELPDEGCLFVVINFEHATAIDCLYELRKKSNYHLLPVFYLGEPPEHHEQILDGYFDETAKERANAIQSRMALIQTEQEKEETDDFEKWLTKYLFVRENFHLKGFLDYRSPSGIHYPLLQILGHREDSQHNLSMLHGMETRKLLKHTALIDEIQTCPHCSAGLLNFKNCCPNCQSVHISTQSFIHCFSCGNTGPLSEFMQQEALICNRCQVRLRHIGIDYDKPIEDKICKDCHHFFFEPNVNAVCMVCTRLSDPEDLQSKKLFEYSLTPRGESLARGIEPYVMVELSQFLKQIDLSIFMMIVNWQTALARRYDQVSFSLVALTIQNEDELIATHGAFKTETLFMELFERIRTLLRNSDLVSRDNNAILFFLPMTPLAGVTTLYKRIRGFTDEQSSGGKKIKVRGSTLSSSEILENNIEDELLLAELYNRSIENG